MIQNQKQSDRLMNKIFETNQLLQKYSDIIFQPMFYEYEPAQTQRMQSSLKKKKILIPKIQTQGFNQPLFCHSSNFKSRSPLRSSKGTYTYNRAVTRMQIDRFKKISQVSQTPRDFSPFRDASISRRIQSQSQSDFDQKLPLIKQGNGFEQIYQGLPSQINSRNGKGIHKYITSYQGVNWINNIR